MSLDKSVGRAGRPEVAGGDGGVGEGQIHAGVLIDRRDMEGGAQSARGMGGGADAAEKHGEGTSDEEGDYMDIDLALDLQMEEGQWTLDGQLGSERRSGGDAGGAVSGAVGNSLRGALAVGLADALQTPQYAPVYNYAHPDPSVAAATALATAQPTLPRERSAKRRVVC